MGRDLFGIEEDDKRNTGVGNLFGVPSGPDASELVNMPTGVSPDEAGKRRSTARELGVDPELVEAAPEQAEQELNARKNRDLFGVSPVTEGFVASRPDVAPVIRDSVEELTYVEGLTNGLKRGVIRAKQSFSQFRAEEAQEQTLDAGRSFSEILDTYTHRKGYSKLLPGPLELLAATERWASSRLFGEQKEAYKEQQARVGELLEQRRALGMSKPAADFMTAVEEGDGTLGKIAAAVSDPVGLAAFATEVGVEAVPVLVAGTAATMATRNPGTGISVLGGLTYSTERYNTPADFFSEAGIDLTDPVQLDALLFNKELNEEARQRGITRGLIIAAADMLTGGIASKSLSSNPIAEIVLQTSAQMVGGGGGEAAASYATTGEVNAAEVIFEAVGELATTPADVAGVGGRSAMFKLRRASEAAKVEAVTEVLDKVSEAASTSKIVQRAPDVYAAHTAEALSDAGVEEIGIPASVFDTLLAEGKITPEKMQALGVAQQVEQVRDFDGDVAIPVSQFAEHILVDPELYAAVREDLRADPTGVTLREAQEAGEDLATEAEVQRELDSTAEAVETDTADPAAEDGITVMPPETDQVLGDAAHEIGMSILFDSAAQAGMTEPQYASYLEAVQRTKEEGRKNKQKAELRREQRKLTKEYQEASERVRVEVEESLRGQPVWEALNSIQQNRLDYGKVAEAFAGDTAAMKRLPKVNGQRIFTTKNEKGVDPDVLADLYGFGDGHAFLYGLVDNPTFEQEVQRGVEAEMEKRFPTKLSRMQELTEAIDALSTPDQYGTMLAFELTRIRQARGQKKISRAAIRTRAAKSLSQMRVDTISPRMFDSNQRREALRAKRAIKAGDLAAAAQHKLRQSLAHEMAVQARRIRSEVQAGNKFLAKFTSSRRKFKSLPIDYLDIIKQVLADYKVGPSPRNLKNLQTWVDEQKFDGIVMSPSELVLRGGEKPHIGQLTLQDWRAVKNSVKDIYKQGMDYNKLRVATEEATVDVIVEEIAEGIADNLSVRAVDAAAEVSDTTVVSRGEQLKATVSKAMDQTTSAVSLMLLNVDSILRNLDGFKSLGPAYTYLKGGIDRAFTEGYGSVTIDGVEHKRVGYMPRLKKESERLTALFDTFTKKERNALSRQYDIPGVRQRLTGHERISVLLNLGNAENMQAMLDSKQFTEMELQAIADAATAKELEFVQSVFDFLDTFRPEIRETVRNRQNRNPKMVEAQAFEARNGTLRGGYFPLKYDGSRAVLDSESNPTVEEARDMLLRGGFSVSHTADGHTQTRQGSGGRPVLLDPHVVNAHLQQLIYDLEMGDAAADTYKVLHSRKLKQAFSDQGQSEVWNALDLWLGDAITGEQRKNDFTERALRHIRTGTTISKLALNISTALLQPLGLLQSSTQIGKRNVAAGLYDLITGNPLKVYEYVTNASGFMQEREQSYNKDIHDAQRGLRNGLLKRNTPGNTADWVASALFLPITKMQRFVDIVTWLGAKRQGLQMFDGDEARSTQHADRMVARTQGSGNFHERTNFERGTINSKVRNTEMVRSWSLFLNYFAAKLNVAYEQTKSRQINPVKHPIQFINWATDMTLLFAVEGMVAGFIKEGFSDDDDDENLFGRMAWEGVKNFMGGVPLVRETISSIEGFDTGGAVGSFVANTARAIEQVDQGEWDASLLKSVNNILGVLFKYPTSQMHKTGQAIYDYTEGEDVQFREFLLGRPRD